MSEIPFLQHPKKNFPIFITSSLSFLIQKQQQCIIVYIFFVWFLHLCGLFGVCLSWSREEASCHFSFFPYYSFFLFGLLVVLLLLFPLPFFPLFSASFPPFLGFFNFFVSWFLQDLILFMWRDKFDSSVIWHV